MINIPRSPAVDRVMTVHNGLAHLVDVYGKQISELAAENHAVRAELQVQKQDHAAALKAKDEIILAHQQRVKELEAQATRLENHIEAVEKKKKDLKELASFDQCG